MQDSGLTPRNLTNFCHHQSSQSGAKDLPSLVDSLKGLIIIIEREYSNSVQSPLAFLPHPPKQYPQALYLPSSPERYKFQFLLFRHLLEKVHLTLRKVLELDGQ